jgi:hypothetical protein
MVKHDELELFDALSRNTKLRAWITYKLTADFSVLVQSNDVDQLRKAQGRAGLLQSMLTLMDQAPNALKR